MQKERFFRKHDLCEVASVVGDPLVSFPLMPGRGEEKLNQSLLISSLNRATTSNPNRAFIKFDTADVV